MNRTTINAVPNGSGKYRIYGMISGMSRVRIGEIADGSKMLYADTVLLLTDSTKYSDAPNHPIEVFASDVSFDNVYKS